MKNRSLKSVFFRIGGALSLLALIFAAFFLPFVLDNAASVAAAETSMAYERTYYPDTETDDNAEAVTASGTFVGTEILNLKELNSLLYVNHSPEKFLPTSEDYNSPFVAGNIERLDSLTPAKYGTLQFFFFNLDPMAENFEKQTETLSHFRRDSESLAYLDLYLPFCFDAATVWYRDKCVSTAGDMGDYDPTEYLDPYSKYEFYPNVIDRAPQYVTLSFPMTRDALYPDRFEAARVVTVHYRAEHGADFSKNLPLTGTNAAIKAAVSSRTNLHVALLAVTASIAVSFAFLILLKRNGTFLGALGILLGEILLLSAGLIPLLGKAGTAAEIIPFAAAFLLLSALVAAKPSDRRVHRFWYAALGVAAANAVLCAVLPLTVSIAAAMPYVKITSSAIAAASLFFGALKWKETKKEIETACLAIACTGGLLSVFLTLSPLFSLHPAAAVGALSAPAVLWFIFADIFRTERRNIALTKNLRAEVAAQTATLQSALADREKILSFLSHDMKKSVLGIDALTGELKRAAPDDAARNTADKIETKNKVLLNSLSEILRFTKRNFTGEPFSAVPLPELLEELGARVKEDCEANGIKFSLSTKRLTVRAKRSALFSVLFNLVFNAIEHAECTEISVRAEKSGERVFLKVTDNGKGLSDNARIFEPYFTGNESDDNSGLGLFIVKSETEAMGGTIAYSGKNGSTFTLSLLSEF